MIQVRCAKCGCPLFETVMEDTYRCAACREVHQVNTLTPGTGRGDPPW